MNNELHIYFQMVINLHIMHYIVSCFRSGIGITKKLRIMNYCKLNEDANCLLNFHLKIMNYINHRRHAIADNFVSYLYHT